MYKNRKDLNKYVENLENSKPANELQALAYSIAEQYFEVEDYESCLKYLRLHLEFKNYDGAAYKLLGQTLHKKGEKQQALQQYLISLEIDPLQPSTIYLDICELLADEEIIIDPSQAQIWCDQADAIFPRHPRTFPLRERLITMSNPNPDELIKLVSSELTLRPKDVHLHGRLLNLYLETNKIKEAYNHAYYVEFKDRTFINDYGWYEILNKLLKYDAHDVMDWSYQLLLLTVKERICLLSITETPNGLSKSIIECEEHLNAYDQAIDNVEKLGGSFEYAEFHIRLLEHHRGQISFHAATLLLKKAKQCKLSWKDATLFAAPLMLTAWQTVPLDPNVIWLITAPEEHEFAVKRWYTEGTYRCSQAGHYLISAKDNYQSLLDQTHWKGKCYKKIFTSKSHDDKINSSYFMSDIFNPSVYRTPENSEVQAYDKVVQRENADSLHHIIWMLLNCDNFADFNFIVFHLPELNATTCAPETLNEMDIYAFLYCVTLSQQQKSRDVNSEKPAVLPANISGLLCTPDQMKWWDSAYKFSRNELGTEFTDVRATLSRGIEVLNCVDNHGLDPELLCILGRIFSERAKQSTDVDDINQLERRACIYYKGAIPLLQMLKNKIPKRTFDKSMFSYTHKELGSEELNTMLEECRLYVAINHLNNNEYKNVIETISNLKSPEAYYYLSQTYKKIALEEHHMSKLALSLSEAETYAFKALNMLSRGRTNKSNVLYTDIQELIEEIRTLLNKTEIDLFAAPNHGNDSYLSSHNLSISQYLPNMNDSRLYHNSISPSKAKTTLYQSRLCISQTLETTAMVRRSQYNKIENEIKDLQKRDNNIDQFMDRTVCWFEENRKMSNNIISAMQTNMQYTKKQFNQIQSSIDEVKDEIKECRNECKEVGKIKEDIAELRKEFDELKKDPVEDETSQMNNHSLYNTQSQLPQAPMPDGQSAHDLAMLLMNNAYSSLNAHYFKPTVTTMQETPNEALRLDSDEVSQPLPPAPSLPANMVFTSQNRPSFFTTPAPQLPANVMFPSSDVLSSSTTTAPPLANNAAVISPDPLSFSTAPAFREIMPPKQTEATSQNWYQTTFTNLPTRYLFNSFEASGSHPESDEVHEDFDSVENGMQIGIDYNDSSISSTTTDTDGNDSDTESYVPSIAEQYIVDGKAPVVTRNDETETNDADLHSEKLEEDNSLSLEPVKLCNREDEQIYNDSDSGEDFERKQRQLEEVHDSEAVYDESSRTEEDSRNDSDDEEEMMEEYVCEGEAFIRQGSDETYCASASIQVIFDHNISKSKILITDAVTTETLADTAIDMINELQMTGDTCMWSTEDYISNDVLLDKTITISFFDSSTALQFYDHYEMPTTEEEWLAVSRLFFKKWNVPNCCGSIDGKHIRIQCPNNSGSEFFNYKSYFSIVLLALVDANYNFLYVDIGCQGRVSDGGVFRNSSLYEALQNESINLPTPRPLPERIMNVPFFFLGDDAFPISPNLMKPFPGQHERGSPKRICNYRFCRGRRVVENAFGILSEKFRIFHSVANLQPEKMKIAAMACVCLHNFIRRNDVDVEDTITIPPPNIEIIRNLEPSMVRNELMNYFLSEHGQLPWQNYIS